MSSPVTHVIPSANAGFAVVDRTLLVNAVKGNFNNLTLRNTFISSNEDGVQTGYGILSRIEKEEDLDISHEAVLGLTKLTTGGQLPGLDVYTPKDGMLASLSDLDTIFSLSHTDGGKSDIQVKQDHDIHPGMSIGDAVVKLNGRIAENVPGTGGIASRAYVSHTSNEGAEVDAAFLALLQGAIVHVVGPHDLGFKPLYVAKLDDGRYLSVEQNGTQFNVSIGLPGEMVTQGYAGRSVTLYRDRQGTVKIHMPEGLLTFANDLNFKSISFEPKDGTRMKLEVLR